MRVDPRLTPGGPRVDRAWFQRLQPKCDESFSDFAFNYNLRRYTMGYDVLTFVITEKLAEGREKLKDDGQNVSLWLSALATFCGHLAKKYQGIELSALLQYLVGWCRLTL